MYNCIVCWQWRDRDMGVPSEHDARYLPFDSMSMDSTAPVWPLNSPAKRGWDGNITFFEICFVFPAPFPLGFLAFSSPPPLPLASSDTVLSLVLLFFPPLPPNNPKQHPRMARLNTPTNTATTMGVLSPKVAFKWSNTPSIPPSTFEYVSTRVARRALNRKLPAWRSCLFTRSEVKKTENTECRTGARSILQTSTSVCYVQERERSLHIATILG